MLLMPQKILPIVTDINDYRYFLLKGGRGGGKSQAVARYILYLCDRYKLRCFCGRELQNSIAESVHPLLVDLINEYNLAFEVTKSHIIHKTNGSQINFRGFREQGSVNIKGMEGVDVLWIDESQQITNQTLDVLIPTIRKQNAKVFFTMNPHVVDDPVVKRFAKRDDCLTIHINYDENPYCSDALRKEAIECKKESQDDYDHIWLGKPLSMAEDAVFDHDELAETMINKKPLSQGYGMRIAGFDIARYGDDKCAVVILQQMGALHWEEIYSDQWGKKDLNHTTGKILEISNEYNCDKCIIDEDGIGAGPLDTLNKGRGLDHFVGFRNPPVSYKDDPFYANPRTKNTYKLKGMVQKQHIAINNKDIIGELLTMRYTYDHYQRKILLSKEKMRKDGVKSPNLADSFIMAVSLIGEIKQEQEVQYVHRPAYSVEESLW